MGSHTDRWVWSKRKATVAELAFWLLCSRRVGTNVSIMGQQPPWIRFLGCIHKRSHAKFNISFLSILDATTLELGDTGVQEWPQTLHRTLCGLVSSHKVVRIGLWEGVCEQMEYVLWWTDDLSRVYSCLSSSDCWDIPQHFPLPRYLVHLLNII